jgi:hypothetical protein
MTLMAFLADLAMRGFAISFRTLARVASLDSFLTFFRIIQPSWQSRWKRCCPVSHSCEMCCRFLSGSITCALCDSIQYRSSANLGQREAECYFVTTAAKMFLLKLRFLRRT